MVHVFHVFRQPQSGAAPSSPGSETGEPKNISNPLSHLFKDLDLEDVLSIFLLEGPISLIHPPKTKECPLKRGLFE